MTTPTGTFACPKCRTPMTVGVPACPKCGQPIAWPAQAPAVAPVPVARGGKKKAFAVALGTAMAVVAIGLAALYATGVLRLWSKAPEPGLRVQAPELPDVLPMRAQVPDSALQVSGMPDNIRDWLRHLERIERKRGELANSQLGRAVGTLMKVQLQKFKGMGDDENADLPTETASIGIDGLRQEWADLLADFRSMPPPEECKPIADTYDPVIVNVGESALDILGKLDEAIKDPEKGADILPELMAKQGKSAETIDKPAAETDRLVQDICDKYKAIKWFRIENDYGGGISKLLSGGMIPGMGL